jgi:hypothetical protein
MTLRSAGLAATALLTLAACGAGSKPESGAPLGDAAPPSPDAGPPPAASLDAGQDAPGDAGLEAPRPLSPLSTSRVTSHRPTLRWVLPSGVADATVDLCLDRACTKPIAAPAHVTGSSYAPAADLPQGVVFWRLHPSTATSVTSKTWQFTVGASSAPVDSSWGTTLDVNGDGYADVVAGEPGGTGAAYVYLGSAAGLASTPATTVFGSAVGAEYAGFGSSVMSAGDVNGDGFSDLVVATAAEALLGVYVYLGGLTGLATTPVTALFPSDPIAQSLSVTSAGDVNGDGYADLAVAATGVYVYLGGPGGLATTPATTLTFSAAPSFADETVVAGAGDVNGDGFGDVVVSAFVSGMSGFKGNGYVYLGGKAGIPTTPASTLAGVLVSSGGGGGSFNLAVAGAGDVNGDGYADVIAAACDTPDCAWVYLGSAAGIVPTAATTLSPAGVGRASAGDVNGDGYGDVVVVANTNDSQFAAVYLGSATGLATTPTTTLTQPNAWNNGFGASIASAGDVNGDGYGDLVVGVPDFVPGNAQDDTGSACIYLGSATGLAASSTTTLVGTAGENGMFGSAVSGASD